MPGQNPHPIRYFQFESFNRPELVHAVFTRHGGISPAPWASLNFGTSTGDAPERVAENRRRAFTALGRDPESIADVWQVHSARVIVAERPHRGATRTLQADALVTDCPEVTLFLRFADCVPVLLYDPRRMAVGLVHAGWKGTVLKAAAAAVRRMVEQYGCNPADILAAIGPSIGPDHYEVGPGRSSRHGGKFGPIFPLQRKVRVVQQVKAAFPRKWESMLISRNGSVHLDLWTANRETLEEVGVGQVEVAGVCTACHNHDYYSHRAEKGRTGRFGVLLGLR